MRASTIIGGASDKNKRNEADFYATPAECTIALIDFLPQTFWENKIIWEPACGDGAISKVFLDRGFSVKSTDLYDRGFGSYGRNFLTDSHPEFDVIVTNPPFNISVDFINRARMFGVPFAMLLKATYWNAARRLDLFNQTKPRYVLPLSWRPAMSPERGKSATMDFAWTVWWPEPSPMCEYEILERP